MNIGTKATLCFVSMTLVDIVLMILSKIYLNLSLDLMDLITLNASTIIFIVGNAISILGLHEVCHCLYCKIKGIEIKGIVMGLKDIGIKVEKAYSQEVRLSSLFSIPITVTASMLVLPVWIMLANTSIACLYCTSDIRSFLRNRVDASY